MMLSKHSVWFGDLSALNEATWQSEMRDINKNAE